MNNKILATTALLIGLGTTTAYADNARDVYDWTTELKGEWKLAPADMQVGKTTKKGPAAKLLNTNETAIVFNTTGKGSAVQEILLPGTKKEMMTMYHCFDKECTTVKATHYCAKKNQPEFRSNVSESSNKKVAFNCDMNTDLCKSDDDHVHKIEHEMLEDDVLQTTYTIWDQGMEKKKSIYRFVRK